MNITVRSAQPEAVEVRGVPTQIDVYSPVSRVEAVAKTVQPEIAGLFLERVGENDWTIWFEDGE